MAFKFRAADHPKAPESDYGSDFTFEEENIVIELLERLQDDQTGAAILEAVQRDPILQADLNAAIAADLFVSSPPDPLGHEDVSANLSGAKHILQAEAETTSDRARPLLERDVRSTIDVDYMPMDGIEYPDCELQKAIVHGQN